MTLDEYEKLPPDEQEHFAECSKCRLPQAPPRHSVLRLEKAEFRLGHKVSGLQDAQPNPGECTGFRAPGGWFHWLQGALFQQSRYNQSGKSDY